MRESVAGLFLAFSLVLFFPPLLRMGFVTSNHLVVLLSFLVIWVPLVGCYLIATLQKRSPSLVRLSHAFLRPIDLVWGLAVGLIARVIATLWEVVFYGQAGSPAASFEEPARGLWWVFASIAAPVLLGPAIEELFFRGLILRTVLRLGGVKPHAALQFSAIAISAVTFAILHTVTAESPASALVIGLSTLTFGVGAAALTTFTGRVGPAVVAHIAFNALVVLPALT